MNADTHSFRRFADVLRRHSLEMDRDIGEALREGAKLVADEAKSRVSQFSKSVPPTIRVEERGVKSVAVAAGGPNTPMAGLLERGNRGGSTSAATFKHPVYGNRTNWVEQPTHQYLRPALHARRHEVEELVAKVTEETVHAVAVESEEL